MKKLMSAVLIFSLCIALCACGVTEPEQTVGSTSETPATTETTTEALETTAETTAPDTETETTTEAATEAVTEEAPGFASETDISLLPSLAEEWEDVEWVRIETNFLLGLPENLSFDAWDICVPGLCYTVFDGETVDELAKYFTVPEISDGGDWVRGSSNVVIEFSNGFRCDMVYSSAGEETKQLYSYVRVLNAENQPVYFTLSDEGVEYLSELLQKIEVGFIAE